MVDGGAWWLIDGDDPGTSSWFSLPGLAWLSVGVFVATVGLLEVDSLEAVTLNAVSVFVLQLRPTSVDEELLQLLSRNQKHVIGSI